MEQSGAIGSNRELMQSDKGSDKGGDPPASDFGAASPASLGATARQGKGGLIVRIGRVWSGLVRFAVGVLFFAEIGGDRLR